MNKITFADIINNNFLEEFAEISIESLLIALLLSCVLSCFVVLIYRLTYGGALFNGSFALSLVLLGMITSLVIITVSSNVVLSLGMVGALSIVRFRTAVKEPMDTIFMFWAIVVGITTGAGLVPIAIIATLFIGLVFLLIHQLTGKLKGSQYMVIIRYETRAAAEIKQALSQLPRTRIKSRSVTPAGEELIVELRLNQKTQEAFDRLEDISGVNEVNLISYSGSTVL